MKVIPLNKLDASVNIDLLIQRESLLELLNTNDIVLNHWIRNLVTWCQAKPHHFEAMRFALAAVMFAQKRNLLNEFENLYEITKHELESLMERCTMHFDRPAQKIITQKLLLSGIMNVARELVYAYRQSKPVGSLGN